MYRLFNTISCKHTNIDEWGIAIVEGRCGKWSRDVSGKVMDIVAVLSIQWRCVECVGWMVDGLCVFYFVACILKMSIELV